MTTDAHPRNKILYILNPNAGPGMPTDLEARIKDHASKHHYQYRIYKLNDSKDEAYIRKMLTDFKPDVAVAGGGDGTVNMVAGILLGKDVLLGILPLGSSNGLALQMDLSKDPNEAMDNLVSGACQEMDVLLVNERFFCLHMGDLGMNARVIKRYEKEGVRGFFGYARQYFKEIGRTRKFKTTIKTDREGVDGHAVMVIVANGSYYGTGANVNPDGALDDGQFEIILVQTYPFWFLVDMVFNMITGKLTKPLLTRVIKCRKATISVFPMQDLQLDGEHAGRIQTVRIMVLDDRIKLIKG